MSSITSISSATSTLSSTKVYDSRDTNEDGVVSTSELVAASLASDSADASADAAADLPTKTAADAVTPQTASAILGLTQSDEANGSSPLADAIDAYRAKNEN